MQGRGTPHQKRIVAHRLCQCGWSALDLLPLRGSPAPLMNDELLGRSLLFAICTSRRPVLCSIVFLQTLAPLERETPRLWGSTVTGCAACVSYEHCPLVSEAFSPRRKLFLWLWARIRGLENRPGDFGAPLGRITGGARIDEVVLPNGTSNGQRMRGNVGAKRSVGGIHVGV